MRSQSVVSASFSSSVASPIRPALPNLFPTGALSNHTFCNVQTFDQPPPRSHHGSVRLLQVRQVPLRADQPPVLGEFPTSGGPNRPKNVSIGKCTLRARFENERVIYYDVNLSLVVLSVRHVCTC